MQKNEVLKIAEDHCLILTDNFLIEVERLAKSGITNEKTSIATLFCVALENLADDYALKDARQSEEYKNLKSLSSAPQNQEWLEELAKLNA